MIEAILEATALQAAALLRAPVADGVLIREVRIRRVTRAHFS
jgi:hypothetical protein